MSVNDQFRYGRIPLKPLSYENRSNAQCNELIVDYGATGDYHIYIADSQDPSKLIDLTNVSIDRITMEFNLGEDDSEEGSSKASLNDIVSFLCNNIIYADDINGFSYNDDISKVIDPLTKSVILRNKDGTIILPVTTMDNIFDDNGNTMEERLNSITRIAFDKIRIIAEEDEQYEFAFEYPCQNYSDYIEVRVNGTCIDNTEYYIINDIDSDGNYNSATLVFINTTYIENGSKVDILFIFNSTINGSSNKIDVISGKILVNHSVPSSKIEKTSNSYMLNDPTSIATSAGLYNLYDKLSELVMNNYDNIIWGTDTSILNTIISVTTDKDFENLTGPFIINTIASCNKKSSVTFSLRYNSEYIYTMDLKYVDGTTLKRGIPANRAISVLAYPDKAVAYIISGGLNGLKSTKYIYRCIGQETEISYSDLNYNIGDIITVYKNGIRLFEDLDYSVNIDAEKITLFTDTDENDYIVFEALNS